MEILSNRFVPHPAEAGTLATKLARASQARHRAIDSPTRLVPMNDASSPAKYQARLTESGLAVDDSIALCAEYCSTRDWNQVKSKALKENLLGKGSQSRISKLLRAVERRVFNAPPPLHCPAAVTRFLAAEKRVPTSTKAQLLLILALNRERDCIGRSRYRRASL